MGTPPVVKNGTLRSRRLSGENPLTLYLNSIYSVWNKGQPITPSGWLLTGR